MNRVEPEIGAWLDQFASNVQNREYEIAFPLYDKNAVAFGTRVNHLSDMSEYAKYQWHNIWNRSRNFTFTDILSSGTDGDLYFCSTLWSTQTVVKETELTRTGRATFIFKKTNGSLICIHSHFSESPTGD